jgi:hypothetical protein
VLQIVRSVVLEMGTEKAPRTSYLTSYNSVLKGRELTCFLKPAALRGSPNKISGSPRTTSPSNLSNDPFPLFVFILVSAAPASRTLSISSANFRSLSLSIAGSNRTLKFLPDGYSDRAGGQGGRGGREYTGTGEEDLGGRGA